MARSSPNTEFEAFKRLLATPELPALDGGPRAGVTPLKSLRQQLDNWFDEAEIPTPARSLLSGIAMEWHDHHDPAHDLAQDEPSVEGNFLHAILHRREPDYWNSKYWFRRVEMHPAFMELARLTAPLLAEHGDSGLQRQLTPGGVWDAFGFVDAVEQAASLSPDHATVQLLKRIQELEFDCLSRHVLEGSRE